MRGLQRSRTIESLVAEAKTLEAQGVSELVLISQDTTRYGEDLGMKRAGLARFIERLLAETGFPWIRFLYAYPKTLDDSVLELMAREPRFVPYVDIPLQHVSRAILSQMRRGGDPASYLAMIERMRRIVPDIAIRTTFIVGFPGEGEAEFRELCEFVRAAEFDNLGAFTYSPEPGSRSEPLGDPVGGRRRSGAGNSCSPSSARSRAARTAPFAAAPSKRSSKAPARRPSTCSKAASVRRPRRSTGACSSTTRAAATSNPAKSCESASRRPTTTTLSERSSEG